MNIQIQRVGPEEVESLHTILRECGLDMKERLGLDHWVPPYPLEAIRRSAQEREVYAVLQDNQNIGTFTIGTDIPPYYRKLPEIWNMWGNSPLQAVYINRLAVVPRLQGQGIGRWCLQTIEDIALERGYEAIRLDAYGKHRGLLTFYSKLGYQQKGHFTFHLKGYGETKTICFEKLREDFLSRE